MSNKVDEKTMKPAAKRALVPKLRFPEFRDAGEWKKTPLDDALSPIVRERKKPVDPYTGLGLRSHGKGTFLKHLENPEKNAMEYLYEVQADDLIVNITFAWEGAIAIAQQTDTGALVSHRFPTYTFKKNVTTPEFFRYVILDKQFIYNLGVISPGGAGRNRVLNKNDFLRISVLLPELDEQQKIADCLSLVDELIMAQAQKLDTLKAHKIGLMQQLFPAEGETLPKLRFPEFREAGEWKERTLSYVLKEHGQKSTGVEEVFSVSVHKGLVNQIEHLGRSFSASSTDHYNRVLPGDIVYTKSPTGNFPLGIIKQSKLDIPVIVSPLYGVFSPETRALGAILDAYFESPENAYIYLEPLVQKGAKNTININNKRFLSGSLILPVNKKEQQKIADCLASIYELVTLEAQKLDTLKAHKKGLMQQLFPALDDDCMDAEGRATQDAKAEVQG